MASVALSMQSQYAPLRYSLRPSFRSAACTDTGPLNTRRASSSNRETAKVDREKSIGLPSLWDVNNRSDNNDRFRQRLGSISSVKIKLSIPFADDLIIVVLQPVVELSLQQPGNFI